MTCQTCRRTGTGASSTTARRSRPAMSSSWPRSSATSPSARWKRASPPVRSRCTRGRRRSSPRSSCTRSTRTRKARRSTSTACWRSASPPRRPPSSSSVTAVIAAAGSGKRLGAGGPKAFVPLAGRPMVEWSVEACRAAASVRSIVVACPPGQIHELAGSDLGVVDGGATRAESVRNALQAVGTELVAIHDAARPLVTAELIESVVATLAADPEAAGAIAATPVTDTIKQAAQPSCAPLGGAESPKGAHVVESTLSRERLWAAQTPQVFRVGALREALEGDPERVADATDEAMLVEAAGSTVLIHPSPVENLKVTTSLDLKLAELLLVAGRSAQ